jgi:hypothetical protein
MDESLKEAERAILCLYDASSDAGTKQSATSFCEGLKSSSDSWRGACQLLVATKEHQVKFWCLQALIEVSSPLRPPQKNYTISLSPPPPASMSMHAAFAATPHSNPHPSPRNSPPQSTAWSKHDCSKQATHSTHIFPAP